MKACLEVWKNEGKEFSDIRVALDWIKYNFGFFFGTIRKRAN